MVPFHKPKFTLKYYLSQELLRETGAFFLTHIQIGSKFPYEKFKSSFIVCGHGNSLSGDAAFFPGR